jgi:hypothetical protein
MPVSLFAGNSIPVSIETVIKTVQMLIATGQADNFIQYCKNKPTLVNVPADTVNALKQFLNQQNVLDPMAASIVGLQQADCDDYQCPHIHNG